jgi:hypothetical protein
MQSITELALRMHESVDFANEHEVVKFLGFIPLGENIFGVRPRTGRSMAEDAMEIGPQGIIHPRRDPYGMYICYAGTPHHSKHIFGFWHINDVDEIYINIPGATADDVGKQIIMMRYPRPGERDYFAWYCQQCSTLLHCIPQEVRRDEHRLPEPPHVPARQRVGARAREVRVVRLGIPGPGARSARHHECPPAR